MIKFLKSFRNYSPGEVAGFSKQHEAWLISKNIAEKFIPPQEDAMAKSSGNEKRDDPGTTKTRQTTVGPQKR